MVGVAYAEAGHCSDVDVPDAGLHDSSDMGYL
jgi:hypothetical protein